ncbi:sigma-54 interaction domain-containing protein [Desulfotruncus alcoholivorax]|uniref:sigma-54 interaction domain-containing protein n=1 Tax=Desulfotruncus alcoholivorax TaxID=265477 RepID=UPI0004217EAC|nr:sigma 54-interacting transcriptional regulator [Desulfotruncus alcoholivorax]
MTGVKLKKDFESCDYPFNLGIVAKSPVMMELVKTALQVAKVDCTVLLQGESGTGKEIIANIIHQYSNRNKPMVKINCGAIPESLLESELFGYERGAFTGARKEGKPGKFEEAHNGTIFLDEIGDLPLHLQVKLLRVLQDKEIVRVGGTEARKINTRVIAATNKDLQQMVLEGKFREDLFYRLNVIPLKVPPLRERREDIMPLIIYFKKVFEEKYNVRRDCSNQVVKIFLSYDWPGNVRELENLIERIYVISDPMEVITPEILIKDYLNINRQKSDEKDVTVHRIITLKKANEELERQLLEMAVEKYKTLKQIARALDVSEATICRKLKKMKIILH